MNYNSYNINTFDNEIQFYTNNICESFNRTLNLKYVGTCKTIFNFKNSIKDTISIYSKNKLYVERNLSITRALNFFNLTYNPKDLITDNDIFKIKKL